MSLPLAKNYSPMNDYPIFTYKRRLVLWGVDCAVTGERILAFTVAYKRYVDYLIRDEIVTDFEWISEAGFLFLKLQGRMHDADLTTDPGPY